MMASKVGKPDKSLTGNELGNDCHHMFLFSEKFHTHSIRIRATTNGKRGNRKCNYAKHDPNMI